MPRVSVPGMGDGLVQARGLRKSFGAFEAVRGIDVDVAPGEVFGFLGPNGAGKSSTMRMIACVSPRSGGTLQVLGMDPDADGPRIRARLGVVPQLDNLDTELTVRENLEIYGRYFGLSRGAGPAPRPTELLEFAQLTDRADTPVEPLSGGMKRRLTIARSLVNDPELLLLDEPTTGLDPQARHLLWDRLYRLKREGVTLIVTTHYMDEAEQLCDRLVVMDGGLIVAEGSPARADRALLHPRGARAAVRAGRPDAGRGRAAGSPSGSRRCRTGCCSTPPTASARWPSWHAAGLRPMSAWCGAGRWRTCSSGSPAGRWWTDDDGDPQPLRPASCPARSAACCWSSSTTGPGTGATGGRRPSRRVLQPLLFLLAFGVGFGALIDGTGRAAQATGGVDYLVWLAPALLVRVRGADGGVRARPTRCCRASSGSGSTWR